jgi:hypothetical protein
MMPIKKYYFMIFLGLTIILFFTFCILLSLPEASSNDFGVGLSQKEFLNLHIPTQSIQENSTHVPEVKTIVFDDSAIQNNTLLLENPDDFNKLFSVTQITDELPKGNHLSPILEEFPSFNEEVACISGHQGYPRSQSSLIFPKKHYLKCSETLKFNPILSITNETLLVKCLYNTGWFYTEGFPKTVSYSEPFPNPVNWTSFSGTIGLKLVTREFVFIKCTSTIKAAYLNLKVSKTASIKSKQKTFSLLQENNLTSTTPLGVHLFLLESMSREHFFRSMRSTLQYINKELIPSFQIYDFQNAHSQDHDTLSNLLPLLFGSDLQTFTQKSVPKNGETLEEALENMQRAYSLWSHYENFGFVTYVAFDSVWGLMKEYTGSRVLADHSLVEFWLVAKQVFGYSDYTPKQRCFGEKNAHRFLIDHTTQFARNYEKHNRFSVTHSSVAAEETGMVLNSFDLDFKEGLQDLIEFYKESKENFAVFVVGDSGRQVKIRDWEYEEVFENKHPACFLITSRGLASNSKINSHENLKHNTKSLVSKFDLYLTLLHLAAVPYEGTQKTTETGIYPDLKRSVDSPSSVSLFLEKIPNKRSCKDISITEDFCFCNSKKEIDINSDLVQNTLMRLTQAYLNHINEDFDGTTCKKLSISKPISARKLQLKSDSKGGNHQIFFKFSVKESAKAEFEFTYYILQSSAYDIQKPDFHRIIVNITSSSAETLDKHMAQLQKAERTDGFHCDSVQTRENSELCVCEE